MPIEEVVDSLNQQIGSWACARNFESHCCCRSVALVIDFCVSAFLSCPHLSNITGRLTLMWSAIRICSPPRNFRIKDGDMTTSFMSTPFPTRKSRRTLKRTSLDTFPRSAAGKAGLRKSGFEKVAVKDSGVFFRLDSLGSQSASSVSGREVEGSSGSLMTSELTDVHSCGFIQIHRHKRLLLYTVGLSVRL